MNQLLGMPAPDGDSSGVQPKDATLAFDPRIELVVPKRAANKLGSPSFRNFQSYATKGGGILDGSVQWLGYSMSRFWGRS